MERADPSSKLWPYIIGWAFIITVFTLVPLTASLFVPNDILMKVCWGIAVMVAVRTSQWAVRWLNEEYEDLKDFPEDNP